MGKFHGSSSSPLPSLPESNVSNDHCYAPQGALSHFYYNPLFPLFPRQVNSLACFSPDRGAFPVKSKTTFPCLGPPSIVGGCSPLLAIRLPLWFISKGNTSVNFLFRWPLAPGQAVSPRGSSLLVPLCNARLLREHDSAALLFFPHPTLPFLRPWVPLPTQFNELPSTVASSFSLHRTLFFFPPILFYFPHGSSAADFSLYHSGPG